MARRSPPSVAVLTMVRDDEFFLRLWRAYYGGLFGARSLYVVSHGDTDMVRDLADGANVIAIPGDHHPKFDARRWRLLNHLMQGLRIFHDVVIVGDVDELVVADPELGSLSDCLSRQRKGRVITPFGVEVMHRPDLDPSPLGMPLLRHRSHVRAAPLYGKPCVVRGDVRLSRGGHYATAEQLIMPEGLYLLHLKHCDRGLYARTMNRRNAVAAATGVARPRDAMIGRHWFAEGRDDAAQFTEVDAAPVVNEFDMSAQRAALARRWQPRKGSDFWECAPDTNPDPTLFRLPSRFADLF